jgi:hypothetical protein
LESGNELYPERQLFGFLNSHALLQLGFKVRGLAHRKHWHPDRQSSHTGWFLLAAALNAQCQLININKLVSEEEQGPSSFEVVLLSKMKALKNHRN